MRILFYDTETTGLPLFDQPSDDPRQPHLVQLAATLVDAQSREVIQSFDLIVRPDGWEIPDEVSRIHGITDAYAASVGVPESTAVMMLMSLWRPATLRVGHVESFDARITRIALKRYFPDDADPWKAGPAECTGKLARAEMGTPKNPKLGDAYTHFTGKPMQDAHSAMADVTACMAVYWAIKGQQLEVPRLAEAPAGAALDNVPFL